MSTTDSIKHLLNAIDELDSSVTIISTNTKEVNAMIMRTKKDIYAIIDTMINNTLDPNKTDSYKYYKLENLKELDKEYHFIIR